MDHRDLHFQDACNRRLFLGRNGAVGLAALASLGLGTSQVQADDAKPNLPGFRMYHPRRNASSICFNLALHRRWICSIPSR